MNEPVDLSIPRCMSCASTNCPGIKGGIGACPLWREAEARSARGEYLPTYPIWDGPMGLEKPWGDRP